MKKMFVLFLITILITCCGMPGILDWTPPTEYITASVMNAEKEPLEGIKVEIFYDKEFSQPFDVNIYDYEEGKHLFTDAFGSFSWGKTLPDSISYVEDKEIYAVVTDTTGIYKGQIKKGTLKYDNRIFGSCHFKFVLSK